jgi:hypothetical protein
MFDFITDQKDMLTDHTEISTLSNPKRSSSKPNEQSSRYHRIESWMILGQDVRHVGDQRESGGPFATQPTVKNPFGYVEVTFTLL